MNPEKNVEPAKKQANGHKDVAVQSDKSVASQVRDTMDDMGVSAADLIIPRLMLMQGTSEAVGDRKAKAGDILNSQTNQVIGGEDKPIEIIPLKLFKTWRVMDMSGKQAEYLREDPSNPDNDAKYRDWEGMEEINGKKVVCRYDLSYNFFVLLRAEVTAKEGFPCVVSFRRTSARAGKALATHLFKQGALQQPSYGKIIRLSIKWDKKDTNTYAVFEITAGEKCSEGELADAKKWLPLLTAMRVDEDRRKESDLGAAPVVVSDGPSAPEDLY